MSQIGLGLASTFVFGKSSPALSSLLNMERDPSPKDHSTGAHEDAPQPELQDTDSSSPPYAPLTADAILRVQTALRTLHAKLSLTEEDIAQAIQRATVKTVSNGSVIMREGELSQFIIWILSGQVSVHRHDKGLLCVLDSGFVGHHSYIYNKPRSATVIASRGAVAYIQLAVPRDGVVYVTISRPSAACDFACRIEDPHELERAELEAMMLASSTMAASLVQEARDAAFHLRGNQGGAKDAFVPPAEALQVDGAA